VYNTERALADVSGRRASHNALQFIVPSWFAPRPDCCGRQTGDINLP